MTKAEIKAALLEIAKQCFKRGQGWSIDTIVLQRFVEQYPNMKGDLKREQFVIESWQELFSEGTLVPGWGLENPSFPFFHVPQR